MVDTAANLSGHCCPQLFNKHRYHHMPSHSSYTVDAILIIFALNLVLYMYHSLDCPYDDRSLFKCWQYLMHFEELDADFALVVERSPLSLNTALPQALSKKQFGT